MNPALPKLPPILQTQIAPVIEPYITLKNVEITALNWANQQSKRASFDALRFVDPDVTSGKLRDGGWADVEINGGILAGAHLTNISFADCDLDSCDFSGAILKNVDLRSSRFQRLKGVSGLRGAIMSYDQLVTMVPGLASELGIKLK